MSLNFWWYISWPPEVQARTLKFFCIKVRDPTSDTLISINLLEFATVVINYAAATTAVYSPAFIPKNNTPYPTLLNLSDNSSALSWIRKATNSTPEGRALSRLLCTLQINNVLGLNGDFIAGKDNKVADGISRHSLSSNTDDPDFYSLFQKFLELQSCRRFHPSQEVLSCLMRALLKGQKTELFHQKMLGHFEAASSFI